MKKFLRYWLTNSSNPKKYVFDIDLALIILFSIALIFLQNGKGQLKGTLKTLVESIIIFFYCRVCSSILYCKKFP